MARDKTDKTDKTLSEARALPGDARPPNPTPDMEIARAINGALGADREADFVFNLYWRAMTLLDDSDLPKAAVAFEMMQSAFSAFEGGLAHKDIADAYPATEWREDTVEIPRDWLRVMVDGWAKYKSGNTGSTLGEAFSVEGGGQGRHPVRESLDQLNRNIRLSNKAEVEYRVAQAEGSNAAWERAFNAVAADEGVSEETVKRAHNRFRKAKLQRFDSLGLLNSEGGKAS